LFLTYQNVWQMAYCLYTLFKQCIHAHIFECHPVSISRSQYSNRHTNS
jgi:hypothetical protein